LSRKPVEEETAATGPASKTIQEESPATTAPTISSVAAHKTGLNEVSASGVTSGLVKTVLRMSRNQSNNREASETEEHAAVTTRATTNVTAPDNLTSSQPCATISVRESLQKIMGQMLPPKTAGAAPTDNKTKHLDRKSSQLVGSQVGSEMQTKSKRTKKRKLEDIVAEKEETKIQEDKLEQEKLVKIDQHKKEENKFIKIKQEKLEENKFIKIKQEKLEENQIEWRSTRNNSSSNDWNRPRKAMKVCLAIQTTTFLHRVFQYKTEIFCTFVG
jgi:hypothetical protein